MPGPIPLMVEVDGTYPGNAGGAGGSQVGGGGNSYGGFPMELVEELEDHGNKILWSRFDGGPVVNGHNQEWICWWWASSWWCMAANSSSNGWWCWCKWWITKYFRTGLPTISGCCAFFVGHWSISEPFKGFAGGNGGGGHKVLNPNNGGLLQWKSPIMEEVEMRNWWLILTQEELMEESEVVL